MLFRVKTVELPTQGIFGDVFQNIIVIVTASNDVIVKRTLKNTLAGRSARRDKEV